MTVPLAQPPRSGVLGTLRRAYRSRKALNGIAQWLIDWALPFFVAAAVLTYILAQTGLLTLDQLYSLWTVDSPLPTQGWSWLIAILGWLAVPAIIGGIAGQVIGQRISRSRSLADHRLFKRSPLRDTFRRPLLLDNISKWYHSPAMHYFAEIFVRVLHANDWRRAQDHWEIAVRDFLSTSAYDQHGRLQALTDARSRTILHIILRATAGKSCPVCEARP